MWYLQDTELLDNLCNGENGLSVRQQAISDGDNDVKGTLQQLPGVGPVQLSGPEHTLNAPPAHSHHYITMDINTRFMRYLHTHTHTITMDINTRSMRYLHTHTHIITIDINTRSMLHLHTHTQDYIQRFIKD